MNIEPIKRGWGQSLNPDMARRPPVLVYNLSRESGHRRQTSESTGKGYANTPDHPEKKPHNLRA